MRVFLRHLQPVDARSRHAGRRRAEPRGSRAWGYGDPGSRALDLGDDAGRIRRARLLWLQGLARNRVGGRLTRRLSLCASRGWLPMFAVKLVSTIICPACGHKATETVPTAPCQYVYECRACSALIKPKPGDCCVFCSYGDTPCPPIQEARENGLRVSSCS